MSMGSAALQEIRGGGVRKFLAKITNKKFLR